MLVKQKIYTALYGVDKGKASFTLQIAIASLIILNVIAVMLETESKIGMKYKDAFNAFELFSVTIFCIEYLARVWVSDLMPQYQPPNSGRIRYLLSPMALIDLLAIVPTFLSMAGVDLRMLRMVRLMRLFKLTRYSTAMSELSCAIKARKDQLVLTLIIMGFLLILCGTLVYFAEHDAQPENFSSIPASLWWAIVTLTTIGYGDVYPITTAGKVIAGVSAIFGVGLIALPGGIIASGLIENAKQKNKIACPHCEKES